MEDRRWIMVAAGVAGGIALFALGLFLGALIASNGDEEAEATSTSVSAVVVSPTTTLGDPTESTVAGDISADPGSMGTYGSPEARTEFIDVIRNSGISGGTEADVLATADEICYHLERLEAQNRSAAFAVRVVWNEALAPVASEDLATFGTVFVAAPHYLCPESAAYAEEVSYWLGY
jgi:hypothetical protein